MRSTDAHRGPGTATLGPGLLDAPLASLAFAVVDIETTGLDPSADEIVEVAIIRTRGDGSTQDEYCTLVGGFHDQPASRTWRHAIDACELEAAPPFADVATEICQRLTDAVTVGHNVRFDLAFLAPSLARSGCSLPAQPYACTLELAMMLGLEEGQHRLSRACSAFGIALTDAHRALGDARATAHLLQCYLHVAQSNGLRTLREIRASGDERPRRVGC